MAIYRGVIRNGIVVPEVTIPSPDGMQVQILVSETAAMNWDEAFERLHKVAQSIAENASPTLNLGKLVEEARKELETDG